MSPLPDQTFLSGPNAAFIAELYGRYLDDPQSVDASWRGFFADLADPPAAVEEELEGPGWGEARPHLIGNGALANGHAVAAPSPAMKSRRRICDPRANPGQRIAGWLAWEPSGPVYAEPQRSNDLQLAHCTKIEMLDSISLC